MAQDHVRYSVRIGKLCREKLEISGQTDTKRQRKRNDVKMARRRIPKTFYVVLPLATRILKGKASSYTHDSTGIFFNLDQKDFPTKFVCHCIETYLENFSPDEKESYFNETKLLLRVQSSSHHRSINFLFLSFFFFRFLILLLKYSLPLIGL